MAPRVARRQHFRLVPPNTPPAPGEPIVQFGRNGGLHQLNSVAAMTSVPQRRIRPRSKSHRRGGARTIHRFRRLDQIGQPIGLYVQQFGQACALRRAQIVITALGG